MIQTWQEFLTQKADHAIDEKQIDSLYQKAHAAVELVQMIRPDLLRNISTIANLAAGAYGVYNSGENKHLLTPDMQKSLVYYGKIDPKNLDRIPRMTIEKYYPNIPKGKIRGGDTIHVNVQRILGETKSDLHAILEIGATIVHEATHENEFHTTGQTSEAGPEAAEKDFLTKAQQFLGSPAGQQFLTRYGVQQSGGQVGSPSPQPPSPIQ